MADSLYGHLSTAEYEIVNFLESSKTAEYCEEVVNSSPSTRELEKWECTPEQYIRACEAAYIILTVETAVKEDANPFAIIAKVQTVIRKLPKSNRYQVFGLFDQIEKVSEYHFDVYEWLIDAYLKGMKALYKDYLGEYSESDFDAFVTGALCPQQLTLSIDTTGKNDTKNSKVINFLPDRYRRLGLDKCKEFFLYDFENKDMNILKRIQAVQKRHKVLTRWLEVYKLEILCLSRVNSLKKYTDDLVYVTTVIEKENEFQSMALQEMEYAFKRELMA